MNINQNKKVIYFKNKRYGNDRRFNARKVRND